MGEASRGDYMDVMLKEYVDEADLFARLQEKLPPGLHVFDFEAMPLRGESLMSLVNGFSYSFITTDAPDDLGDRVSELVSREEILVSRKVKQKKPKKGRGWKRREKVFAEVDIRPMIESLSLKKQEGPNATLIFTTCDDNGRLAKPKEIMSLLGISAEKTRVTKDNTLLKGERARVVV